MMMMFYYYIRWRLKLMSGTTTRRLPDRTWHVSRGGARSSAAGDPDERHDCDNDDATPPTIDYCNCHSSSDNDVGCSHPPSAIG